MSTITIVKLFFEADGLWAEGDGVVVGGGCSWADGLGAEGGCCQADVKGDTVSRIIMNDSKGKC